MRSIKELMEEMGFNKDAPVETQKAFIKHLIASANQLDQTKVEPTPAQKKNIEIAPIQLEFDLGDRRVS
jgi:hypothetical protein